MMAISTRLSSRVFARLFSMTWSSTTPSEITPLHQCLKPSTTNLRRQLSTLSRDADSDHRGFSSLQPPSSLSPSAQERYCSFAAVRVIWHNFPSKKVLQNDQKKICNLNLKNLRLLKSQRWRNLRSKRRPKLSHWATWR